VRMAAVVGRIIMRLAVQQPHGCAYVHACHLRAA
jgi:hypothetical protein